MEIRAIADCKTSLGEGPLWDVQEQKIYWLDSLGNKVFRANADGSHMEKWDLPQKVGSMALRKAGGAILCLQTGLCSFDFNSGEASLLFDPEPDKPFPADQRSGMLGDNERKRSLRDPWGGPRRRGTAARACP